MENDIRLSIGYKCGSILVIHMGYKAWAFIKIDETCERRFLLADIGSPVNDLILQQERDTSDEGSAAKDGVCGDLGF